MCTSSGRKAASEALNPEQRRSASLVNRSKFVGGKAALSKSLEIGSANRQGMYRNAVRQEDRLGAEAGGGYVNPSAYGGRMVDSGGEANDRTAVFNYRAPSENVSADGKSWTGQSGRVYRIGSSTTSKQQYADGVDTSYSFSSAAGLSAKEFQDHRSSYVTPTSGRPKASLDNNATEDSDYFNWNIGTTKGTPNEGKGVDVGKTEAEARATYKDFGMDFDKDEYKGEFYTTEKGLSTGQRINVAATEGKRRKLNRMRGGAGAGSGGATTGNARLKGKKQGNLRLNRAGVQGGQTGGGTSLF